VALVAALLTLLPVSPRTLEGAEEVLEIRLEPEGSGEATGGENLPADFGDQPQAESLSLDQLSLVAVVMAADGQTAMVDYGGQGLLLRQGSPIGPNNGYVKSIGPDNVVIEERQVDDSGDIILKETTLRIDRQVD
jgi:Tfp pilus assembly protein PilP